MSIDTKPGFVHTVYFYAAEGLTEQRKTEFMTGLADLAKTPSIQKVYYGPPAGTDREVVDNNYLIAWICHFASSEDHDAYQKDPIHLKFIEDYKELPPKVQAAVTVGIGPAAMSLNLPCTFIRLSKPLARKIEAAMVER